MSNGTRDRRPILSYPADGQARAAIDEWLAGGEESTLFGNGLDFRGADLSGLTFFELWALESDFSETRLRGVDMPAAHLSASTFRRADLTGIAMPDAVANETDFTGACLTDSNLRELEARRSRFVAADLTRSEIGGSLEESDLRDAVLVDARFLHLDLYRAKLNTSLRGAEGVVFGPFFVDLDGVDRLVGDRQAEQWFKDRGAEVDVREIDRGAEDSAPGRHPRDRGDAAPR